MTKPSMVDLGKGGVSGVATIPTQCSSGTFLVIYWGVELPKVPVSKAFSHSDGKRTIGISGGSSGNGPGLLTLSSALASLEEDFITWREQFWPAVCEHFGVEATGEESRCVWEHLLLGGRDWPPLTALGCCSLSSALHPLPDSRRA